MSESLAGRSYAQVYRVSTKRGDVHRFLVDSVRRAGGEVLYASPADRAPVYLGIQGQHDERIGVLVYPFRCSPTQIKGRRPDEHRVQIRYGGQDSWVGEHRIGRDVAGVDTTLVLGVHLESDLLIGLDPVLYDPLPMGISVEFKQSNVDAAQASGWHVWERENRPGRRRGVARAREGLEAVVAFTPERLLAYVGFERRSTGLGLDPPLRFRAAEIAASDPLVPGVRSSHALEDEFELSSQDILEIIANRSRLSVAVRGGVAEHHLLRTLRASPDVEQITPIDRDGEPDLEVVLRSGRRLLIECKNVSPHRYADGSPRVEVQKTRSQKDDPAGRFYRPEQFDVVAACLYAVSGSWEFRFKPTNIMERHEQHPDRLAVYHRVDASWTADLAQSIGE